MSKVIRTGVFWLSTLGSCHSQNITTLPGQRNAGAPPLALLGRVREVVELKNISCNWCLVASFRAQVREVDGLMQTPAWRPAWSLTEAVISARLDLSFLPYTIGETLKCTVSHFEFYESFFMIQLIRFFLITEGTHPYKLTILFLSMRVRERWEVPRKNHRHLSL